MRMGIVDEENILTFDTIRTRKSFSLKPQDSTVLSSVNIFPGDG